MLVRVEPAYRERSIEHLAPAFIHGSEAEVLIGKHFADERSLAFPFQAALLRDPPYLDVFVIGQFRHTARIRAAARPVTTGRRAVVQRFHAAALRCKCAGTAGTPAPVRAAWLAAVVPWLASESS